MKEEQAQEGTHDQRQCLLGCITPDQADDKLQALYEGARELMGFIPNAAQLFGISPHVLEEHWRHIGYYSTNPTLSRGLLAYLRYAVASKVQCEYCVDMNLGFLVQAGVPLETLREAGRDPEKMPLSGAEKAMARFVLKVVDDQHAVSADDISELRQHGWSEKDMLEAAYHAAHALAIDMVLDAFRVQNDIPPVQ